MSQYLTGYGWLIVRMAVGFLFVICVPLAYEGANRVTFDNAFGLPGEVKKKSPASNASVPAPKTGPVPDAGSAQPSSGPRAKGSRKCALVIRDLPRGLSQPCDVDLADEDSYAVLASTDYVRQIRGNEFSIRTLSDSLIRVVGVLGIALLTFLFAIPGVKHLEARNATAEEAEDATALGRAAVVLGVFMTSVISIAILAAGSHGNYKFHIIIGFLFASVSAAYEFMRIDSKWRKGVETIKSKDMLSLRHAYLCNVLNAVLAVIAAIFVTISFATYGLFVATFGEGFVGPPLTGVAVCTVVALGFAVYDVVRPIKEDIVRIQNRIKMLDDPGAGQPEKPWSS